LARGVTEACWNRTYIRQLSGKIGATVAEAEFAAFYRAEMAAVVRHVMNQGAGEQEAADAAQTAFVQAYQAWETISHPRAWVRTVAARSFLRSLPWIREIPADTSVLEDAVAGPAIGKVEFSTEEQVVLEALAGLPRGQREAMAWHFDGFTPTEIAERLGTSSAAVRQSLARARRNLARRLGTTGTTGRQAG
jgi:RNA polymerase sigma factor (sigma-70 family)